MADEKVQLKREEVVGNEIVLEDIFPRSTTSSIINSATGEDLNKVLERMLNSINNKLSRVVNSVNKRPGVVTLTSDDVGLGNVDNVSYDTIKEYIINKLDEEFGNKIILLADNLNEVDAIVAQNDKIHVDTPFYSVNGYNTDKKGYIGYIYLDTVADELRQTCLSIKSVGYTNNSIIYDEQLNDVDMCGGGLSVNIWKYEDALEIYNGLNKGESGLRIRKDLITGKIYQFMGVYGNSTSSDTNALLYFDAATTPPTAPTVKIFIDDEQVIFGFKLRRTGLKVGDIILCNFKDYRPLNGIVPNGMSSDLLSRNTGIGMVRSTPIDGDENSEYTIYFYTIKPKVGMGIQNLSNHQTGMIDTEITPKLIAGTAIASGKPGGVNMSGLQVLRGSKDPNPVNFNTVSSVPDNLRYTVLPHGAHKTFVDAESDGGIFITPDMSMCVMPFYSYGPGNVDEATYNDSGVMKSFGSKVADNWYAKTPTDLSEASLSNGSLEEYCLFGINLLKTVKDTGIKHAGSMVFSNISGLKILHANSPDQPISDPLTLEELGLNVNDYETFDPATEHSGGLALNVGKFLEIAPLTPFEKDKDYYGGGQVNVRIGKGLKEEPITYDVDNNRITGNRIQVKTDNTNGGLGFDANGNLIISNLKILRFSDSLGTQYSYNPIPAAVTGQGYTDITLGPGLKITL